MGCGCGCYLLVCALVWYMVAGLLFLRRLFDACDCDFGRVFVWHSGRWLPVNSVVYSWS